MSVERYSGNEPEPGGPGGPWYPSMEWVTSRQVLRTTVAAGEAMPAVGEVLLLDDDSPVRVESIAGRVVTLMPLPLDDDPGGSTMWVVTNAGELERE